jgi:putative phosphoesterase
MKRIGLISDTHGSLAAEIFDLFAGVDLIVHAGDVGKEEVLIELRTIAPVRAVYGNVDAFPIRGQYPRIDFFEMAGKRFCLTHIIGSPKSFAYELFKMNKKVDVVVYGHTHKAEQTEFEQILFVNPGSASQPRNSSKRSVAILEIEGGLFAVKVKYF